MPKKSSNNSGEFPFMIERPSDNRHLNLIIYGDSGSGKTAFAGSAQDCEATSPVLFMDLEGGTRTLMGKEIDVTRPSSWKEIQDIYEYLRHDNVKYRSFAIDGLTELQKKFSMGSILGDIDDLDDQAIADLSRSTAPKIQDWLRTGEQMRKNIRAFRDLAFMPRIDGRIHVIMTALERLNEKRGIACPQLSGALGEECGAMVDFLLRLSRQNVADEDGEVILKRHLLTDDYVSDEGVKYMGKNRGSMLPKGIWNPTIADLIEYTEGGKEV